MNHSKEIMFNAYHTIHLSWHVDLSTILPQKHNNEMSQSANPVWHNRPNCCSTARISIYQYMIQSWKNHMMGNHIIRYRGVAGSFHKWNDIFIHSCWNYWLFSSINPASLYATGPAVGFELRLNLGLCIHFGAKTGGHGTLRLIEG